MLSGSNSEPAYNVDHGHRYFVLALRKFDCDKIGLSVNQIDIILLASPTSFPELLKGIGFVAAVGAPDIAIGYLLGNCMVNLSKLSMIDSCADGSRLPLRKSSAYVVLLLGFCADRLRGNQYATWADDAGTRHRPYLILCTVDSTYCCIWPMDMCWHNT